MPFSRSVLGFETPFVKSAYEQTPEPNASAEMAAAVRQQSIEYAAWDYFTRRHNYAPDPNFSVGDFVRRNSPELRTNPEYFPLARAQSLSEFYAIKQRIDQEKKDKEILGRAGWSGIAWQVVAGALSPTMLIPLVGASAKGVQALRQGAALGALAVGIDESMLQLAQESRSWKETAFGIGAGMVLGGILGGAVGAVRANRAAYAALVARAEADFTAAELAVGASVAMPKVGQPSSVGAKQALEAPTGTVGLFGITEGTFSKFGVGKFSLEQLGPVTRGLNQVFFNARWITAQISDAGLSVTGLRPGAVAAQGGLLSELRKGWNAGLYRALKGYDAEWAKYVFGDEVPKVAVGPRAFIRSRMTPELMTKDRFDLAVSRYSRGSENWTEGLDERAQAAVKNAGDIMEREVYTPMFERMKELGMVPENLKLVGDTKYLNRIYDVQKILDNPARFLDILENHFRGKRAKMIEGEIKRLNQQIIKAKVAEEDQTLPAEWAAKRREVLKEQLAKLKAGDPTTAQVLDQLVDLRKLSRRAKKAGDESLVEQYAAEIKRLKKEHHEALTAYRKAKGAVNERLRNLDKNIELLDDLRSKKMAQIDKVLEQQSGTIERLSVRYLKFAKELEKYSPEMLKAEYGRISALFDDAVKSYERAQVKVQKLLDEDEGDLAKTLTLQWNAFTRAERMRKIQARLDAAKNKLDTGEATINALWEEREELVAVGRDLNNARADIINKLREQVAALDPRIVSAALDKRKAELGLKRGDLREKLRARGFDDVELGDVEQQVLDFTTNERLREFYARWFQRDPTAVDIFRDVTKLSMVGPFDADFVSRSTDVISPGFHEAINKFKTSNDALKWISENSADESYRIIARRLLGTAEVEIIQVQPGDILPSGGNIGRTSSAFFFAMDRSSTRPVKEVGFIAVPFGPFVSESTLLHEIIHAASVKQIMTDPALHRKFAEYRDAIIAEIYEVPSGTQLPDDITPGQLSAVIPDWLARVTPNFNADEQVIKDVAYFLLGGQNLDVNNIRELITVGLSNPAVVEVLKQIKLPGMQPIGQSAWDWFVKQFSKLFGFSQEEGTALGRLLELADETFEEQLPLEAVSKLSYFDPRRPTWVDAGARDIAENVMNKIVGDPLHRLSSYDWLAVEQRGPELERTLDISSQAIEDFLDNNPERLLRAYVRTIAPDLELYARFGSVTAAPQLARLKAEYQAMRNAALNPEVKKQMIAEVEAKLAASTDEIEQRQLNFQLEGLRSRLDPTDIHKAYERAVEDIQAMVGRMRHTWGVPKNPGGTGARLARIAMQLNTLRFMGMVLPSSFADVGRLVAKYGVVRAYKSGLRPLIKQFNTLRISAREAQLAGTGLDVFLHTRMYEMMELLEDGAARTKLESGLDMLTSKIGIVGGFDYWNTTMKMFTAVLTNAEILDSIQTLVEAGHKGARSADRSSKFLASLNIDSASAEEIWQLVKAGGGGLHGDVWLPNTEDWLDAAAEVGIPQDRARFLQRLYRAALVREVDSGIVTTGVERPLWMDRNLGFRLISQFKSFTATSTFHVLMAGLQGRNANFALSAAISLAMGALSYKVWMFSVYGPNPDNHPNVGWEKWADEMIDRSGLLGAFAEVRNIGSSIPWVADAITFSGAPPTRFGGVGTAGKLLGPTADLVETAARVAGGVDEPTQPWARQVRKLLPYQNVWWARHTIFDPLVEAADLPEKRKRRDDK